MRASGIAETAVRDSASSIAFEIVQRPASALAEYAQLPSWFEVLRIAEVFGGLEGGSFGFVERQLKVQYLKDYDQDSEGGPLTWPQRFGAANLGLFAAYRGGEHVGGAAVVLGTQDLELHAHEDLAVLWDLRVLPAARGLGVATRLLEAAEHWAASRAARWLKVETQNVNVPACRFYRRSGFELRAAKADAYPKLPHEVMLLWYKELTARP